MTADVAEYVGKGNEHALLMELHTGTATMEISRSFLEKLKIDLLKDPATPLLGIYLRSLCLTTEMLALPCPLMFCSQ